jgi:ADP-glucose pyrophosphorylase
VGRYSKITKAVIDKDNIIPPKTTIGCDPDEYKKGIWWHHAVLPWDPKVSSETFSLDPYPIDNF